jgi:hypothetical protein
MVGGNEVFNILVASPVFTSHGHLMPLLQLVYQGTKNRSNVPTHVALSSIPLQNAAIGWSKMQSAKRRKGLFAFS